MQIKHIREIAKHMNESQDIAMSQLLQAIQDGILKTQTVQQLVDNKILSLRQIKEASSNVVFNRGMRASFNKEGEQSLTDEDYFLKASTVFVHENDVTEWLNT